MHTHGEAQKNIASEIMPQIITKAPWRITEVRVLSSYTLWVKFNDGIEGTVSLSGLVHSQHAGVFAALRDEKLFMQVALKYGAVTWPGELDLAPDAMYEAIRHV
jgi:hypothetical protein